MVFALDHSIGETSRFRALRWGLSSRSSIALTFAGLLLLPGCYAYQEVPPPSLATGVQARVRLDPEAFGRVLNEAAMNQVPQDFLDRAGRGVVGRVTVVGPTDLQMELRGPGTSLFRVEFPLQSVRSAGERRLDRRRSILAMAGTLLFVTAVFGSGIVGGTTSLPDDAEPFLQVVPPGDWGGGMSGGNPSRPPPW